MSNAPERMDLTALSDACQRESSRFFNNAEADNRYCYELFRRALKLRNAHAWEAIWHNYTNLVRGWLHASGADNLSIPRDELVTMSFERFWQAMSSRSFDEFPTLPALLKYLRLCCVCTVADLLRQNRYEEYAPLDDIHDIAGDTRPDRAFTDEEQRNLLWQVIDKAIQSEAERVIVQGCYLYGLKPNQVYQQHHQLFESVNDVYRMKRNLFNRLRRLPELRQIWDGD